MAERQTNVLYGGDNLDTPRRYAPYASIERIYLDPLLNSNRDCGVLR